MLREKSWRRDLKRMKKDKGHRELEDSEERYMGMRDR